jgi:hypothetical protein
MAIFSPAAHIWLMRCKVSRGRSAIVDSVARWCASPGVSFAQLPPPTEAYDSGIMAKLDEQISTLQERLTQLKLRQQRSDARKRALAAQRERKAEARRQFIVGAVVLGKVGSGDLERALLQRWLDEALTRSEDRALFDLPPLANIAR